MNKIRGWIMLGCCSMVLTAFAQGQARQKPGLWEVTSSMDMGAGAPQMPQMPQGMQMPPGMHMPASPYAPHTTQACVTQAMIDKYGGPYSNPPHGDCQVTNIVMKPDGMTAKITCSGQMSGSGTVESSWTDTNSTKTTVHFTGSMSMGADNHPVDWTMKSTSVYKGPDCGDVKPAPMPQSK